jgi:photosystem II stability/assembly factor-like uncharacterized protein
MIRLLLASFITIGLSQTCLAQDWKPVTVELLKSEKTGFGGLCGVAVHPPSGDLIINLSDRGLFQSMDQGTTWQRLGTAELKGRTETPLCLMIDPLKHNRLVSSFVYGSPIIVSEGLEGHWKTLAADSQHVDWCAVEWNDPELHFILTLKHESGDVLLVSRDGGKSFSEVGKGYGPAWVFDRTTAVVAEAKSKSNEKPGLLRTTDAGKTFQRCSDAYARALPQYKEDQLFWLTTTGLIHSSDLGKSWDQRSEVQNGICGPVFGSKIDHLLVLSMKGILESKDGGKTWQQPISLPAEMKGANHLSWIQYDALHDILYVMKMGSELYQWRRMKP